MIPTRQCLLACNDRHPRLVPAGLAGLCAALLLAALFFQYVWGLLPCVLCIDQRWAYLAALVLAAGAAVIRGTPARRGLLLASALALVACAGIAAFQVGVEQHWWAGTAECGSTIHAATLDDLRALLDQAPVVRCDEVQWSLLGISMAGYNIPIALALAVVAALAALSGSPRRPS
ncbi:MAG: disulfide bond formation protein B [Azospirillaceae bacterium]|nr:disulfide bond formation protein B [Azospirillaceae bacterium]